MGVFVFPNDATDQVLVRATFFDETGVQTLATVIRVHADGSEHVVQDAITPLCEEIYVNDTIPPLDETVHYRITATPDNPNIISADVTLTRATDLVWLRSPSRPWANLMMTLCPDRTPCGPAPSPCLAFVSWGTETYAADAELVPVHDRPRPVPITARRKDAAVDRLRFLSVHADGDCSCIESVRTLFTAGGSVNLSFPPEYCIPDRCYQPGDLTMAYITPDQRKPYRLWEVPLVAVDCPVTNPQGVAEDTWCDVNEDYATYAALTATGFFWGQVRSGQATAPPLLDGYGAGPYGSGPYGS